jgi:hypothetical protein
MSRLNPDKLHVRLRHGAVPADLQMPRRYTLTHSDLTGDLFLVIGADYDRRAISGLYTRLMRDEVLAEWISVEDGPALHVYCHVSGGLVFGFPSWRNEILLYHMPQVLQALRYGDQALYDARPELDQAPVFVHFRASQARYRRKEAWGVMSDYHLVTTQGESAGDK